MAFYETNLEFNVVFGTIKPLKSAPDMHVPVRLTTASAASAASAALAHYSRAPRDGAYEAASMTDAGPPTAISPPSRQQKPTSPPQPVTRDPGEASTATLHNPAAESRTSSTSSGATLHAAFETPDPEPSSSSARQRRQALRPVDCGLPVAQNVSVGSRFHAHVIGRQHREKAAAERFRTNDKWLLDVRAGQDAPRLQRERLRKIKEHFLLSTESASRFPSARNPRPASPVRRRPTSPVRLMVASTDNERTMNVLAPDKKQGKAAMAPGADASVFAYYPSVPHDGAYKAADKGAAARRTNFLSQTTYHICGKISLGGIEELNQHLPPAVHDHQYCTSRCRDSRPDDEPERLAHDGPLLAHLADQEHFHKAIPVQVNVKRDAHGEQMLCLQHMLPGVEPTQSASLLIQLRLSALTMSRYWGCPSSTQRIIELGVPGYEQVGSIYLKLGSYACIKRLANLVGREDFE